MYGFRLGHSGRSQPAPLPPCDAPAIQWLTAWPASRPALSCLGSRFGPALVCSDTSTLYALHFAGEGLAQAEAELAVHADPGNPVQAQPWLRAWEHQQPAPGTLAAVGTPFQHRVWQQLLRIPRGWLTTYGAIAVAIGKPGAARAVGHAVGQNPLGGWIPCHRVLPAHGIGHYRWGGQVVKTALLEAEGVTASP